MWYIYITEFYSAIKKNEIMPFVAAWMELEIIILSEGTKTNTVWFHLYMESKHIVRRNLFTKEKEDHRHSTQINS